MTQQSSILHESQVLSLQRESENYIRKVEQEKKHFYSIEENYQSAKKDWQEKKEELKQVPSPPTLDPIRQNTPQGQAEDQRHQQPPAPA